MAITSKQPFFPTCYGTEFTSKAILKWANENGIEWHYIDPFVGKTVHWTVF